MSKTKDELIAILIAQLKLFIDKFFVPNVGIIQIVQSKDINEATLTIIKNKVMMEYNLREKQIIVTKPKVMLSLDLGTGYYLGMIHDIQGKYEIMRHGFKVNKDGGLENTQKSPVKYWSDVYFNPKFDLRQVPQLIS